MNLPTLPLSPYLSPSSTCSDAGRSHRLDVGTAVRLRPSHPCEIRIDHGSAWLTFGGQPHRRPLGHMGDLQLNPGARLVLARGDDVVLEPLAPAPDVRIEPVRYTMQPLTTRPLRGQIETLSPAPPSTGHCRDWQLA